MTPAPTQSKLLRALALLAGLFIFAPLASVFLRVPWSQLWATTSSSVVRSALLVSMQTSLVATIVCVVCGVPVAWWLARTSGAIVRVVRVVCVAPIVLPPVVGGIALLAAFGRRGVVGQWLYDWWGLSLPFTRTAVVIAQVFVSMPFLILAVESAFRQAESGLEDAARTLGAGPLRVFFSIAVPASVPAIASGAVLAWARSLGEFGASITFAGSLPGKTQTLPMSVYELASTDYTTALVVSVLMIVVSVVILGGLRDRWLTGGTR